MLSRKFVVGGLAALVVAAGAGCGSSGGSSGTTSSGLGTTLTWYTTIQAQDAQPLIAAFKQKTGITVQLYTAATPTVEQKLNSEEAAGRYNADVFTIGDENEVNTLISKKYAAKLPSSVTSTVPSQYVDPNGYWFGTRVTVIGIAYNTKTVTGANIPTTWTDLLKPFWKDKLDIMSSQLTSTAYYTDWQIIQDSALGKPYLEALGKQDPQVQAHSGDAVNDVVSGQADAAVVSDDAVWPEIATGAPLKMVYPTDGVGNFADYELVLAHAPHPAAAMAFAQFLASAQAGKLFAQTGAYSTLPSVAPVPTGRPPLSQLKLFPSNQVLASTQQAGLLPWLKTTLGE